MQLKKLQKSSLVISEEKESIVNPFGIMEYREFFLRVWHKMNDSILKQLETRVEKKVPKKKLSSKSQFVCERS